MVNLNKLEILVNIQKQEVESNLHNKTMFEMWAFDVIDCLLEESKQLRQELKEMYALTKELKQYVR